MYLSENYFFVRLSGKIAILFLILFGGIKIQATAQISEPSDPEFKKPEPINTGGQHYTNSNLTKYKQQQSRRGTPMGATSQDIMNQYNRHHSTAPVYKPGMTRNERQQASRRYIQQQMANDPAYNTPNPNNNFSQQALKREQELLSLLNEVNREERNRRSSMDYYKSRAYLEKTQSFHRALQNITDMLKGEKPLSVRSAFYQVESAYGNAYLNEKEYYNKIKECAAFIKAWLKQNGYDLNSNEDLHFGIQKFMGDTLTISTPPSPEFNQTAQTITHLPFGYDYEDYKGLKDHRNYFVTKTFATGYGQCDGLPDVYIAIAEELGAKVYMSLAPFHSFVKYPDNKGIIHNYEPTSDWNISDKWYKDYMFISSRAIRTGIYLDTLNREQIVASSLLDLAFAYLVKHGAADGSFINACVKSAMQFYPKQHNLRAYFLVSSVLARHLERKLYEHGIKDLKNMDKAPGARQLYERLRKNEELISQLGYQEMPPSLYEKLLEEHEFKGRIQKNNNTDGKQKRNLFIYN